MSTEAKKVKGKTKAKCTRCGDMFYHPKTVIEDMRQLAQEWEEIAKYAQRDLEIAIKYLESIALADPNAPPSSLVASTALAFIKDRTKWEK